MCITGVVILRPARGRTGTAEEQSVVDVVGGADGRAAVVREGSLPTGGVMTAPSSTATKRIGPQCLLGARTLVLHDKRTGPVYVRVLPSRQLRRHPVDLGISDPADGRFGMVQKLSTQAKHINFAIFQVLSLNECSWFEEIMYSLIFIITWTTGIVMS